MEQPSSWPPAQSIGAVLGGTCTYWLLQETAQPGEPFGKCISVELAEPASHLQGSQGVHPFSSYSENRGGGLLAELILWLSVSQNHSNHVSWVNPLLKYPKGRSKVEIEQPLPISKAR